MKKKAISLILALAMVFTLLPGFSISAHGAETSDTYTYDMPISEVPVNWSPMSWASGADQFVMQYTQTPLVDISIKNSDTGEFQWIFLAATDITDVTEDITGGSVFEIALNPNLCWEDGTPITADSYIWSMQQMLDSEMQHPRASLYYEGTAALAGAKNYYFAGRMLMEKNEEYWFVNSEADLITGQDGNYYTADGSALYILLTTGLNWNYGSSLDDYVSMYGDTYFDAAAYAQLKAMADDSGNVVLNAATLELLQAVISKPAWGEGPEYFMYYIARGEVLPDADWDTVGLKKVDDYTLRYHCEMPHSEFRFLYNCCAYNWLIHQETYEACKADGTYGTSPETTMSYGPYKLQSVDDSKVVLVRNEKHFEYTADAEGNLSSVTSFQVDGGYVPQWQTDTIAAYVLPSYEVQQRFLAGSLDYWEKPADISAFLQSPALYRAPTDNTFSMHMNTSLEDLQNMDANYGGVNSAVLSNESFRKAFSLSLDRTDPNIAAGNRLPALGLFSEAYYYDAENNPDSRFRKSEVAMQAICDTYGVTYGPGTAYPTLEEAYAAVTGYDLARAQALMAQACRELVDAGLYTEGEPIVLTYAASSESTTTTNFINAVSAALNAAAQGSGFGTITISPRYVGFNWSGEMKNGNVAMAQGGWSGSALDPFSMMQMYLEPMFSYVPNNMDTETEMLTLNISGKDYTMTWMDWYRALNGAWVEGAGMELYHNPEALAKLEGAYLQQYFTIPLISDCNNIMLGHQVSYFTREYSVLYGFGGIRLMTFNYTDAEWEAIVASGELDYSGSSGGEEGGDCGNGHVYDEVVTAPTCTEQGYTTYTCSVCGDSYVTDYVSATGHSFEKGECTVCGEEDPDYVATIATGWSGYTQWTLTADGVLTFSGTGNMKNYGYDGGQPWLAYADQIKSVVIEKGVTAVGTGAFMNLPALESVTLPESGLTKIGEAAFYGCTALEEIYIPDGVYTIWAYTFKGCSALTEVRLPKTLIKIDQGAFENCTALDYVYIPGETEIIGSWSFKGCTGLKEADMQWADATEIREGAFKNCSALTRIYLPTNIQVLGDSAFYGIGAKTFTVPATVTEVGPWCFARASLTEIIFEGNAPTIGEGAFNKITLTAYYPSGNATWTSAVKQNYGGTVTWKAK